MLLEIEAEYGMAEQPGSLMDRALVGMITSFSTSHPQLARLLFSPSTEQDPQRSHEPSDYLNTLLRDPTASHLLETLVRRAPAPVFPILWATYFQGKLSRLAVHPVANFVVQKAVGRLGADELGKACEELDGEVARKVVKANRVGVLHALVERAAAVHHHEEQVVEVRFCIAFDIPRRLTECLSLFVLHSHLRSPTILAWSCLASFALLMWKYAYPRSCRLLALNQC